ncbi:MAG: hypothetical protein QOH06_5374 [Acidobacteriota bacterium]|jgi:hypothetical protein|nr:hypothetical protein [Acidobacteriota bacterium]
MKTQISRDSFNSDKRYSGVYLQQGRMITDADWNEETEISRRRLDDALADTVTSGVPRDNGLKLEAVAGQPLRLRRGRVYAGGVGALVTSTLADPAQPFGLNQQADLPLPDAVAPPATGYRLYADVWERAVTSLEDAPQLRDPAFHGADTAARTQTMAQLKWCNAADPNVDPENLAVNPRMGDARLTLTLRSQLAGLDPCDPCAREITIPPRVGNYLFRLEVHAVEGGPKNPTRVVLKWSGENGAEAHAVGTEPADFKGSDWVYEYFTTRTEKHLGVHLAGGIAPLAGQLVEGFPAAAPDGFPFVRRWDGYCSLRRQGNQWSLQDGRERGVDLSTGSAADADGHVAFGNNGLGVQLSTLTLDLGLSDQTSFVAGDYWLAPVRESVDEPGDVVLDEAPPVGIRHSYLLLATIDGTGALTAPDTNRQQRLDFPSLTTLAARDVDYTANCPSGLFNATHDTVQKALDRVCGIDATHVGFDKPCDTSIYKGVDAASINTVAKALALLCDVRAEQISYNNDDACKVLSGAKTVQEALHLLCMHESAGGCRTTIGLGGDFPTLKEAVDDFLARGETALCFCLLPGEHLVEEKLTLTQKLEQRLDICLEGCGPASRILLKGGLVFNGVASVRWADVAIEIGAEATFEAQGGEEVALEGCAITIPDHDASTPIFVAASRLVRLAGNDVQALRISRLKLAREVFTVAPTLQKLFSERASTEEFAAGAHEAAEKLSVVSQAQRTGLASKLDTEIRKHESPTSADDRLEPAEAQSLRQVAKALSSQARDRTASLERALHDARKVFLSAEASLAVVLGAGGGDAELVDNSIIGVLSVYDRPGEVEIVEELDKLRGRIQAGWVNLQAKEESLLLARNRISQLRADGELIIRLRDAALSGSPGPKEQGLFRTARLTDNVFKLGGNHLVCLEATLSGNRFAAQVPRLGTVIADTAFYFGNHGTPNESFRVINVAPRTNTGTRSDLNTVFIGEA